MQRGASKACSDEIEDYTEISMLCRIVSINNYDELIRSVKEYFGKSTEISGKLEMLMQTHFSGSTKSINCLGLQK